MKATTCQRQKKGRTLTSNRRLCKQFDRLNTRMKNAGVSDASVSYCWLADDELEVLVNTTPDVSLVDHQDLCMQIDNALDSTLDLLWPGWSADKSCQGAMFITNSKEWVIDHKNKDGAMKRVTLCEA